MATSPSSSPFAATADLVDRFSPTSIVITCIGVIFILPRFIAVSRRGKPRVHFVVSELGLIYDAITAHSKCRIPDLHCSRPLDQQSQRVAFDYFDNQRHKVTPSSRAVFVASVL